MEPSERFSHPWDLQTPAPFSSSLPGYKASGFALSFSQCSVSPRALSIKANQWLTETYKFMSQNKPYLLLSWSPHIFVIVTEKWLIDALLPQVIPPPGVHVLHILLRSNSHNPAAQLALSSYSATASYLPSHSWLVQSLTCLALSCMRNPS
jgi:hypothetical protein